MAQKYIEGDVVMYDNKNHGCQRAKRRKSL